MTMPERYEPDEHAEGGPCMVASEYGQWVALCDYATLESRLREVEAERDALKEELDNGGAGQVSVVWVGGDEWHDEWCAWYKPEEWPLGSHRAASAFIAQKVATLRAELKALKEGRES